MFPKSPTNSSVLCVESKSDFIVFMLFHITCILLLLPLCTFILHHGLQQWRQKRSTSSAVTVSHSDSFTYHSVTIDLLRVVGCGINCWGVYSGQIFFIWVGIHIFSFTWLGQTFFHLLTCVERYLAVVHPITYRNLKTERGIRIRNISIACAWLLSFTGISSLQIVRFYIIIDCCIVVLCTIIIFLCSLSVLRVLIRPGPGDKGGKQERVDQSKLRAFYTITAILGVLVLRNTWEMVWISFYIVDRVIDDCVILAYDVLFNLPSSLVLPLLFLHRAGKLECCKKNVTEICRLIQHNK